MLHHARAAHLLRRQRRDDYRAELRLDRPDRGPDVCEIAGAAIPHVLAEWPLLGPIVASARLAAVCDADAAADLRRRYAGARIEALPFGAADPLAGAAASPAGAGAPAAGARGAPAGDPLVFAVCPPTAAVRRLDPILDAFAALPAAPTARLHLLGPVAAAGAPRGRLDALRVAGRTTLEPGVDPDAALRAADVCICLAWPPAGETTPLWLRCLAAGKPTIVGARPRPEEAPLLDPRTWRHRHGGPEEGVAVAVDPLDETATLALAMRRLAADPARRAALGRRGRRYWERKHRAAAMADGYRRVIRAAGAAPAPDPDGPAASPAGRRSGACPRHRRAHGSDGRRPRRGRRLLMPAAERTMFERTVSPEDLDRLARRRQDAERGYNDALTLLDRALPRPFEAGAGAVGPDDAGPAGLDAPAATPWPPPDVPRRYRWLLPLLAPLVGPAFAQQERINRALVAHLNERAAAARAERRRAEETAARIGAHLSETLTFQSRLLQYLQRITLFVDTRDREVAGLMRRINEGQRRPPSPA